jgi:hypothetical protein
MKMHNLKGFNEFLNESSNTSGGASFSVWSKWKSLINMSASEIQNFLDSEQGKDAGLTRKQAKQEGGIKTGRDSARALIRMIPTGGTWEKALDNWSHGDWAWARRQVSFNSRMRGMKPTSRDPYKEDDGDYTRWYKSMLIWGHDPKKPIGKINKEPKNLKPEHK